MAGRKPGTPKTGGRKAGTPNKATAAIRDIARQYTSEAIEKLVHVMRTSDQPTAIIGAANSLLDRGYGKPSTVLSGDEEGGPVALAQTIELVGVRAREG